MLKKLLNYFNRNLTRALLSFLVLVLTSTIAFAQNKTLTGQVVGSDNGQPIPGVTVKLKGGNETTSTNSKGNFSINVPESGTLVFSYVGYNKQEVDYTGKTSLSINLAPDNKTLSEVVVIGYGTAKRKDLTGAVSSISAATIDKLPVASIEQSLQGRAAGVQVTNNDGAPGANVNINIRGIGSLASYGNGPLYVIDGYPIGGGLNNFNPNDIASIDILKDASATAIYGIRAANGVVIITTKKGRRDGGIQVSLDAYNSFQTKPKEYSVLNASDFANLASQVAAADPTKHFTLFAPWSTPSTLTNADWQNALYRTSETQSISLGLRGGNDKSQSSTSLGYYDQKGLVLGSYFKRITLGMNLDYTPNKWLKSATSAKYTYQDQNNPFGTGSLVQLSELPPTLDGGNSVTSQISDGKGNYGFYNPIYTYVAKYSNPVYSIETNQYRNITNYLLANTSLEISPLDGLKIKSSLGVNINDYSGSYFSPEDDRLVNQYGSQAGSSQNAYFHESSNNNFEWLWENTIAYDKTIGQHAINFLAGVSDQTNTQVLFGGSVIPPNSIIKDLSQGTNLKLDVYNPSTNPNQGNGTVVSSLASQFGRLTYKFADKYIVTGTVRRDGSSKFDDGHKYGIFPSGAIAWKAKEESFLKNENWLTDLKFRGSYGEVGNQGSIPVYQYQATYSTGSAAATSGNLGYPFGKSGATDGTYQSGIAATQPANPNLRWETDYQTDIGMDASFLSGDLNLTVDYFNRKSKDFLLNIAVPAQTGFLTESENIGTMNNKGFEFALNYNHRKSTDFTYGANLTLSFIKNTLTSLFSGANSITNFGGLTVNGIGWSTFTQTNIGQPVGEFYGYKSKGIFQTQAQVDALNAAAVAKGFAYYQQPGTGPGDRYFEDTNGDGAISPSDQVSLGSPQPKFFGGLNLDATYKGFDINLYFYGVYGNKILDYQESALESFQNRGFVGVENVSRDYYLNRWTSSNPSNKYARASYNDDAIGNLLPSSAWIQDGSFLKLKNLTIGYTLPIGIAKTVNLSKVRVYFSTQNLFTITKYTGLDPEIGVQNGNATQTGVDSGTYPSSRYYTFGLNLSF